ncbi:MAG: hypothetical protein ABI168_06860 [Ginsengibacter sp.]
MNRQDNKTSKREKAVAKSRLNVSMRLRALYQLSGQEGYFKKTDVHDDNLSKMLLIIYYGRDILSFLGQGHNYSS